MLKQYDPKAHEARIYEKWEKSGVFSPSAQDKPPFVVVMPPPNVTGSLHMGHALENTLTDVLIRYHRMKGEPTVWVPGTDHAALPTNALIEKQLRAEGLTKHDIGREQFMERVQVWYDKYGNTIVDQLKRLGCSCDWNHFTFTLDPKYVEAVLTAFIRYYEKGYIYRGNRLVNWCPHCASVISDLEIKHEEQETQLVTLRYPLQEGEGHIEVATTRPETMLGDTAVAVNPSDERYKTLVGKTVVLPLVNRTIPIVADEAIDPRFGTGAVKVTPAHDPLDAEIGQRHKLPIINVIGEDGKMTAGAGEFAGLPTVEARHHVLEDLQAGGFVVASESYRHEVGVCERCGTVIEPLVSKQWFANMTHLKEHTRRAVEQDLITFHGPRWKQHLLDWVEHEHDWTISRQIWLGQRIPVWWKPSTRGSDREEGNYQVSLEKPTGEWEQDPDVLDTWFSSALWPLATLGWPKETEDLKRFYPTSFLTTAREILYLWEHRMIFTGMEFTGHIPFRHVMIHPTVLTKQGKRMSKSLGTGIDPLELIEAYGADATRFGLMFQMSYDQQALRFDETIIKTARNFANKVWNVARFLTLLPDRTETTAADEWITWRSGQVTAEVTRLLDDFKLGEAARVLYDFIWSDFADWYVEILKHRGSKQVAQQVFTTILKLLHPFMPTITEVLWEQGSSDGMLISASWPEERNLSTTTPPAVAVLEQFKEAVATARSWKTLLGIKQFDTLYSPHDFGVLQDVLVAMAAAAHYEKPAGGQVLQLPTAGGSYITVSSTELTDHTLGEAYQRVKNELDQLAKQQTIQRDILKRMQENQVESAKISAKEGELQHLQQRIAEAKTSLDVIGSVWKNPSQDN